MQQEFSKVAADVIEYTTKGINLLSESHDLLRSVNQISEPAALETFVHELSEKQKRAVEFIQAAMQMEKALMLTQKRGIEALVKRIQ